MDRHRGDHLGDGDQYPRMPRWPSDGPPNQDQRIPRVGEGFFGGRYHPYRGSSDNTLSGVQAFRDGLGSLSGSQMPMGGQKRVFSGVGGSPDFGEGNKIAKLFIGSVPKTATEEDIRPLFEEHGEVVEVAFIRDRRTGHQQGCCFIKYASLEHADRAVTALHNQYTLPGATAPLQVKYADHERERFGLAEDKLFVASLNRWASEKEVEEIFAIYGHVEDVYLMKNEMKQSRGCGFVKFSNKEMALAAMNALHGTYVMRGCDQPLIVRFAEPKRPRPADQRSFTSFGGHGFGPQSDAVVLNRHPENFDESHGGHRPSKGWTPLSSQTQGPSEPSTHEFGRHTAAVDGIASTSSLNAGSFGDGMPPAGALPNLVPVLSTSQNFNPPIAQASPALGQQILPFKKSLPPSQHLPPSLPMHNAPLSFPHAQTQTLQAPLQHGQIQLSGLNSFGQAQQTIGLNGQPSASPSLAPQNATAANLQNPLGLQQQGLPAVSNQQQLPLSNITQQLLQQPGHQLPAQMLLQQQAQTLQSSYQSSQQAIFQIQQQLQMMQHSNISTKQQSPWSGLPRSSTPAIVNVTAVPSTVSATPFLSLSTLSGAAASTCDWTEHTSPEGFKYYYNSGTRESKWEKPEELSVFEHQQQQKLLLLQQQQLLLQQQKIDASQLTSPSHIASQMQVQTHVQHIQQAPQTQVQSRPQAQLQNLQLSLAYQASGVSGHQIGQELSNPHQHGVGSVFDSAKVQQISQEWVWKNKHAGHVI